VVTSKDLYEAAEFTKIAASNGEFDETTPAANTEQLEGDKAEMSDKEKESDKKKKGKNPFPPKDDAAAPTEEAVPPEEEAPVGPGAPAEEAAVPPGDEFAAVPEGAPAEDMAPDAGGQSTPEEAGANAARSFLGEDTMQAALSGDPGAQDLVARTAGQVAGSVSAEAARSQSMQAPAEAPMPEEEPLPEEGEVPVEGEDPAMGGQPIPGAASPEDELANEIAPAPAQAPVGAQPAPGGPQQMPVQGIDAEQGEMDQGKGPATQVVPGAPAGPVPAGPTSGTPSYRRRSSEANTNG